MVEAGLMALLEPTTLLLLLLGTVAGVVLGVIPGISATMAVALFLPFTFGLTPIAGFAMLMGLYIGGLSGGLITAILLNIPGNPASIATTFDGAPMARKGEASKALGIGIFSSFLGSFVGFAFLVSLSPQIARIALRFAPFEYFALTIFSITLISSLTGKHVAKGLLSGLLGMLLATVGTSPIDLYHRFTFGMHQLTAGFNLIPVLVGMYAITEVLSAVRDRDLESAEIVDFKLKGLGFKLSEYKSQIVNFFRSSLIGVGIGILPGIGAGTSALIAYATARNQSKYPEKFGTGIIDGVVAPESCNSAAVGGALIPLLTLGIPGDAVTAILLGGLMIHGIVPGPTLFQNHGDLVFSIFGSYFIATILMLVIMYLGMRIFVKMLKIPKDVLFSVVVVLCAVGAFGDNNRSFDIIALIGIGIAGYLLSVLKFPLPPIVLGFILGPIAELNLRRGLMLTQGDFIPFLTRPISAAFLLIALASVAFSVIKNLRKNKKAG